MQIPRSLRRLFKRLTTMGDRPEDDEATRLRHYFVVGMGLAMAGGGILWGSICFAYGLYGPAAIPFGYTLITALNFLYFSTKKNFEVTRFIQIAISLLLPFLFQWSLGGFIASGAVMLWALFALFGSFSFSGPKFLVRILGAYIALTVAAGLLDSTVRPYSVNVPIGISVLFFVLNISVISSIVFGMVYYMLHQHKVNVELEGVDRVRAEFLSTVSHELRTPLTSILGFNQMNASRMDKVVLPALEGQPAAAKTGVQIRQNIEIILKEGQRLTALINDVLDLSKMEAGVIDWELRPISMEDVLRHSVAATSGLFGQKPSVTLALDLGTASSPVLGNRDRLVQVFLNLISNAVKFTDSGAVKISSRNLDSQGPWIEICVQDSGQGISPSDLELIFERFQQARESAKSRPGGTGLGLPICRKIVEHHGGRVWAESTPGKGSQFFVRLPLRPELTADVPDTAQAPTAPLTGSRVVLVVDDDESFRELLRQNLTERGFPVQVASSGAEGLELAGRVKPDLMVVDVVMPGMSGFELTRRLKSGAQTRAIPVVMLSVLEDSGSGGKSGADRYLTKPIDPDKLNEAINSLLAAKGGAPNA